jgi:hypothetical protein
MHGGDEKCIQNSVGTPQEKRPLKTVGRRWEDSIKKDLTERRCEGVSWFI